MTPKHAKNDKHLSGRVHRAGKCFDSYRIFFLQVSYLNVYSSTADKSANAFSKSRSAANVWFTVS